MCQYSVVYNDIASGAVAKYVHRILYFSHYHMTHSVTAVVPMREISEHLFC